MIKVSSTLKKSAGSRPVTKGKGTPPTLEDTRRNLVKPPAGTTVPIQIKTSPEIRKAFRTYAVEHDLKLHQLFEAMFEFYRKHRG